MNRLPAALLALVLCPAVARADGAEASSAQARESTPSTTPATTRSTTKATTQPTTQAGYVRGLVVSVYKLPRVPHRIRRLLPGQMPDATATLGSLRAADKSAFGGLDNNIQADIVGEIRVEQAGVYEFEAESDDGIELRINDDFVLADRWINGSAPPSTGSATLRAGWNALRLGYYQGDGGLGFRIRMRRAGEADYADVPGESLRVDNVRLLDAIAASLPTGPTTVPADAPWRSAYTSKGYAEINDDEAELIIDLFEGPTSLSLAARKEWQSYSTTIGYDKLPASQQSMTISGFLRGWYYGQTPRSFAGDRAAFTLSAPERVENYEGWRGADRSGYRHKMTIDSHEIILLTPEADYSERDDVPKAIAGLPRYLRQLIKEIKVEPYGTAREFNGGGSTIWIRLGGPARLETLDSVLAHEAGHLLMSRTNCYEPWVAAIAKDTLSVSRYGRQNPSEDFAEFVRLYVSTNNDPAQLASLRTLFPARMKLLEALVKEVS